jgi:hypothetical protein
MRFGRHFGTRTDDECQAAVGPGTHATSLDEMAALMYCVRRRIDGA